MDVHNQMRISFKYFSKKNGQKCQSLKLIDIFLKDLQLLLDTLVHHKSKYSWGCKK